MKRSGILLVGAATVLAVVLWYVLLLGPQRSEHRRLGEQTAAAQRQEQELRSTLVRLRQLEAGRAAREAELARLRRLVPPEVDVAGFILAANDAAVRSAVDWISVAPAGAVAGAAGGPSTIALSIAVNGGFAAVVDYLRHLEELDRLVVVDSLRLSVGGQGTGPFRLAATMSARLFTTAGAAATTQGTGVAATTTPTPTVPRPAPVGAGAG
jgi:Tfp pilus assembly protein PilO